MRLDRRGRLFPPFVPPALSARDAVQHLVRLGLLDLDPVVRGDVAVADLSGRHRNLGVARAQGTGFLLKQGASAQGLASVVREARVLRLLDDRVPELARYLPCCVACDDERGLLVLELVPGARRLGSEAARRGRFPAAVAGELGAALAALHAGTAGAFLRSPERSPPPRAAGARLRLAGDPPWVLSLHRPASSDLSTVSSANLDLVRLLQSSRALCAALDRLRLGWRRLTLVHNDLRWENCLVSSRGDGRVPHLRIVDWEMADVGDPAWDVGFALGNWLGSELEPRARGRASGRREVSGDAGDAHRTMHAFWSTYREHAGLDGLAVERLLVRSARFAAARLVQLEYERHQDAARLGPGTRRLLRVAAGILRSPADAVADLLRRPRPGFRGLAVPRPAPAAWGRSPATT